MAWFEGTEIKVRLVYFLCLLLLIMAVVSAISTFLIGIIICIATVLVAICGAVGARFNSHKLLWWFMMGLVVLIGLSIVSIIWELIKSKGFSGWMIKDLILIVFYGTGIFLAFTLRGRSFRYNPVVGQNANFQKL
ncbi:hypothetical protein PPL_00506 [Heterostelium album PN500]|uniref:Uncharacterized protein n=1 Tax=Heterostelium pallidum (strain ATCC 26659 / Pp 5 / PN500) TaxID=670386 RepID=D3AWN0_HETP5|nr:hypothetical protein PPL_00506 [Heterostelium album PN500]EFA86703.1 hypothetical protein PPL_00506 [Heterostelium album PN500]|eukprot:XP_020438807.1 hypothetical protein PPL_00506 [Heterostelium album PN500]